MITYVASLSPIILSSSENPEISVLFNLGTPNALALAGNVLAKLPPSPTQLIIQYEIQNADQSFHMILRSDSFPSPTIDSSSPFVLDEMASNINGVSIAGQGALTNFSINPSQGITLGGTFLQQIEFPNFPQGWDGLQIKFSIFSEDGNVYVKTYDNAAVTIEMSLSAPNISNSDLVIGPSSSGFTTTPFSGLLVTELNLPKPPTQLKGTITGTILPLVPVFVFEMTFNAIVDSFGNINGSLISPSMINGAIVTGRVSGTLNGNDLRLGIFDGNIDFRGSGSSIPAALTGIIGTIQITPSNSTNCICCP